MVGSSSIHCKACVFLVDMQANDNGDCDGGDLVLDSSFAAEISGLASTVTFTIDVVVSDASVVDGDARQSSSVSCLSVALEVTV